ncbi:hypothetical protein [Dechloromonas sp. ZS-1]|uniref:hypothetical protein n=1 Tax=Dechloromonas sp. ZS-1 TaxID=3138067 RepID=UPI0031FC6E9F
MKSRFLALHPLLGTKNKPAALHLQERSPYYWWWAYLRRNADYLACCEAGGVGELGWLYADFGDVRTDDFRSWWGGSEQRGAKLFGEQAIEHRLTEITEVDVFQNHKDIGLAVISVNLNINKRKLQQYFANWLTTVHKGKPGRRSLGKEGVSSAKYPLHRNFSQHNLRLMLAVYDAWTANQALPKPERKTMWQVGEALKLVPTAITKARDTQAERTNKLNVMTVAVSRYVKQAKAIIANTAKGQFPNSKL